MWILIDEQEFSKQKSCAILTSTLGPLHMLFHLPGKLLPFYSLPSSTLNGITHSLCISTTLTFSGRPLWVCKLSWFPTYRKFFIEVTFLFFVPSSQFAFAWTFVYYLINVCYIYSCELCDSRDSLLYL